MVSFHLNLHIYIIRMKLNIFSNNFFTIWGSYYVKFLFMFLPVFHLDCFCSLILRALYILRKTVLWMFIVLLYFDNLMVFTFSSYWYRRSFLRLLPMPIWKTWMKKSLMMMIFTTRYDFYFLFFYYKSGFNILKQLIDFSDQKVWG